MKKTFPAVFLLLSLFLSAQQRKIDSLFAVLKDKKEDTNRVNSLNSLGTLLNRSGLYSAADSSGRQSLALAQRLNFQHGISGAYRTIGSSFYSRHNSPEANKNYTAAFRIDSANNYIWGLGFDYACLGLVKAQQGQFDDALKLYQTALKYLQDSKNEDYLFRTYQFIGLVNKKRGNYPAALTYYLKSLDEAERTGNKQVAGDDYMDIGNVYTEQGNDSLAMQNYMMALKRFGEINNPKGMGNAYCNIGNIFHDKNKNEEALNYYRKALEIAQETGDKEGMTNSYGNMGNIYEAMGNYPEALWNHNKSLQIDQEIGDKEGVAEDYLNISGVLTMQKKYNEAMAYTDKAMVLANELGSKLILKSCYEGKALLDTALGNYASAYTNYKKYIVYRDSLVNEDNTKKIVSEQMKYEFDKKQAEEKAIQEKKDVENEAVAKRQSIITWAVSIGLLLVIIFSALLFSRFKVTQQQKQIIEEQKELVEEKNKEVLDSITYAKRLQDAILPPISVIQKYLPESFVLYKPKDIVAGDFYWLEKAGDTIFIAAADCTGHGVPGAMVSVVCSNALNRAVKEFKITEPGKILDKVRELVLETFSQRDPSGEKSEGEIKDGMDISLLAISKSAGTISWAGAYNSLWYWENGEIKEIAADKQPIGKSDNPKPFTTHTLDSHRDARAFYLFTDGYADQFGGDKGKKFKYKHLQEKLLANSLLSMVEQKKILEEALMQWQGDHEQVDDILIIGVKV